VFFWEGGVVFFGWWLGFSLNGVTGVGGKGRWAGGSILFFCILLVFGGFLFMFCVGE